ncbi:Fe-S cluster assembly protein SufD [Lysinibacillus sphaericus]|uniref:SufD n=3 Tax=Lysinibacillus TaxID=400634 RepID=A0A2S5CWB6_LYSSH|nr:MULTISPECIES: Fe-S cluster assembly protein SufD [Lysinibacillus]AHN23065.1 Fe-S cluster assembly protein SufD [Lysinibacillus varians]AVK95705.1 Fe-S cluster assembly protein SufD [Lysinibacillus sphaericus]MCS1382852.1 Fe-S cluster assembly protein SufD [Lysinibacillus sphaericus]MED4545686.1 Fe-S cluster assembly protein SufD [Lysinibacillus sphaericus]OEC03172.1 Fe-S cluster assembly protein SufD [Lysinibacillus sphaericus]
MTVELNLPVTVQDVRSFSEANGEPTWFAELRTAALDKAAGLDMPKPDRTNITKWDFMNFPTHTVVSEELTSLDELPEEARGLINLESQENLYIQRNNTPAFIKTSQELADKGVIFTDMLTAVREHGELVQKYFMTEAVKVDEHKLTALHAALVNGGVFVYVPKNVVIEQPLQVVFLNDNAEASLYNHVLVVAEANAAVTYVETYISTVEEAKGQANIISEVIVQDNAQVIYGAVDVLAKGYTTYVNRRARLARDAKVDWALGLMNDSDTISENITHLIGDGSHADTKTVVVGRGEQKLNFTTEVRHWGKNSNGHILKHGVMKDAAQSIFNGIGYIEHGATKADAQQESRVLMLSEKARGDANPILLIDEDDVTAGHAASVGRVDPLQLYYLMSRGISKAEAERLVIHGFLAPVVTQLPIEGVQKQLTEVIERKVR